MWWASLVYDVVLLVGTVPDLVFERVGDLGHIRAIEVWSYWYSVTATELSASLYYGPSPHDGSDNRLNYNNQLYTALLEQLHY